VIEAERLDPVVGREPLLLELIDLMGKHRLVTLTGPGGTGKTRVAAALVERLRESREAFLFDLSSLVDGEQLAATLVPMLLLTENEQPTDTVRQWAQGGPRILGLDNIEQANGIARPIVELLNAAPELRILATSRTPVGAVGEYEVRIPGLSLPAGDELAAVEQSPAGALFLERARSLGSLRGQLDPQVAADIAALCRLLGGLPLGIELAAARARILSPGAIRRRLEDHDAGVLSRSTGPERHRSLAAVLDWSIGLLSAAERGLLEACAACTGTFGLELVAWTADSANILPALETLAAHGLVATSEEVASEPRFSLLESVRLTVLANAAPRLGALGRRHAEAVADLVDTWAPLLEGAHTREALAHLDADLANLEAAIDWSLENDVHLALQLMSASVEYWSIRGWARRSIAGLRRVLESPGLAPGERALGLGALIRLLGRYGSDEEAQPLAREAAELAKRLGMHSVELEALSWIAFAGEESGLRVDRREVIARMVAISPTTIRDEILVFDARYLLEQDLHGLAGGRQFLEDAIPRVRANGNVKHLGLCLANLAFDSLRLGESAKAIAAAEECVALARDLGQPVLEAYCLTVSSIALAESGAIKRAGDAIARALALSSALGTSPQMMDAFRARGTIAAIEGRPLEAAWFLGAAEAAYAPSPLADPLDDKSSGASRHWKAAKRQVGAVAWELAQRDGRTASRDEVLARALATPVTSPEGSRPPPLRHGVLTAREVEILSLLADGTSDREIADKLYISPKTASVHVANAKAKLGAASRLDLALKARDLLGIAAPGPIGQREIAGL